MFTSANGAGTLVLAGKKPERWIALRNTRHGVIQWQVKNTEDLELPSVVTDYKRRRDMLIAVYGNENDGPGVVSKCIDGSWAIGEVITDANGTKTVVCLPGQEDYWMDLVEGKTSPRFHLQITGNWK